MLPIWSIFFLLILALLRTWFTQHGNRHWFIVTDDVCQFTAYCVTKFSTVLHVTFWRFLFIRPIAPNKNAREK